MAPQQGPDKPVLHSYNDRKQVDIPPGVLAATPVAAPDRQVLPLNLLANIISHVDDVADLARLTRTSRILYYMALPKLWERVTFRSYSEVRYVDGRPEGFGAGSPFTMGLASLVASGNAKHVRYLSLIGEYKETDIEDYAKGRVPNDAMMLNIALRASIDRLPRLEEFEWRLSIKMSQISYQGLAMRPALTSLTLKFPSSRTPRPTALIPPMPHLRKLTCLDMDPLAYPDDISLLLVGSKKLESLILHWNPRIRKNAEQCINLTSYFHRCMTSGYALKLKNLAMYNLYAAHTDIDRVLDPDYLESVHTVSAFGRNEAETVFLDDTWKRVRPSGIPTKLKMMRTDVVEREHVQMITRCTGLERLYILSQPRKPSRQSSESISTPAAALSRSSTAISIEESPKTPATDINVNTPQSQKFDRGESISLASDYLAAIQHQHGAFIRHLLLPDEWHLNSNVVKKLLMACPNIEQLALSLTDFFPTELRVFFPFGRKLTAFRILNRINPELLDKVTAVDDQVHAFMIGHDLWYPEFDTLKYLEFGNQMIFRCGRVLPHPGRKGHLIRSMKKVPYEEVEHLAIWAMDTREVV